MRNGKQSTKYGGQGELTAGVLRSPFLKQRSLIRPVFPGMTGFPTVGVARCLTVLALLGLIILPFSACGRKTAVKPPELVIPQVISNLAARNVTGGIDLTWARPRRYADGTAMNDLAGFRIERGAGEAPFESLATLEVSDRDRFRQIRRFRYQDLSSKAEVSYRYRVFSFTLDGYVSQPSNLVEIVRIVPPPSTPEPADR